MMKINFLKQLILLLSLTSCYCFAMAQNENAEEERLIKLPDIPGYKTLKCDLHTHSVFSDGHVWPTIRVQEAIKDGLDALAITEHIEYQPYSKDIPNPDRNRSYQIALDAAKGSDLIVISGAEITRDMPPGHSNAIFLKDVNELNVKDSVEAFKLAKKQGAFIFWNHPNWISQRADGMATLTDLHKKMIKEGQLTGIEIVNDVTYSDEAFQIAIDNNLAVIGTSDIHGLVDWQYNIYKGGHRPVTLVFAKEKSEASIKEALFDKRTAVWFNNYLFGAAIFLEPLIKASLVIHEAKPLLNWDGTQSKVQIVEINNNSDVDFIFENLSEFTMHTTAKVLTLKAHEKTEIQVKTLGKKAPFDLKFRVLNAFTAPKKNAEITINVKSVE
jgi:hypothetical protein